jgi:hypothetical protein
MPPNKKKERLVDEKPYNIVEHVEDFHKQVC